MFATLVDVDDGLRAVMAALDPAAVDGRDAVAALEQFARIEKMAGAGKMLMATRVAETNAWKPSGTPSPEAYLASISGCSLAEAASLLGTARRLGRLPATAKAARQGALSARQAKDVADASVADPTAEEDLLDLARQASASELREEARRRRHAAAGNDAQRHARLRARRALRAWTDDEGAAHVHWNHLPEAGAEVGAILDGYIQDQFHRARREGRRERREAYAADALVDAMRDAAAFRRGESLADEDGPDDAVGGTRADPAPAGAAPAGNRAATRPSGRAGPTVVPDRPSATDLDGVGAGAGDAEGDGAEGDGAEGAGGGEADGADGEGGRALIGTGMAGSAAADVSDRSAPPGRPPDGSARRRRKRTNRKGQRRRGADAKVIVRIDHSALVRGHTEAGEICEIAGIGPVPVASVVELMDDAFLAAVVVDGHDVHTVAHLGRRPSAYQDTALQAAGVECTTLGCPNRERLERDHRTPYRVTRHSHLRELDWSCGHCHERKTYEGAVLAPGTGKRPLLTLAEQAEWNRVHPDDPCDPPQTTYPSRGRPTSTPRASAASGAPGRPTTTPRSRSVDGDPRPGHPATNDAHPASSGAEHLRLDR